MSSKTILRAAQAGAKTGIARSGLYARTNPDSQQYDPTFPLPIKIGPRSVGWIGEELDAWIERRAQTARVKPGASRKQADDPKRGA